MQTPTQTSAYPPPPVHQSPADLVPARPRVAQPRPAQRRIGQQRPGAHPHPSQRPSRRPRTKRGAFPFLWVAFIGGLAFTLIAFVLFLVGGLFLMGGNRALMGVQVGGVPVGGLDAAEIEAAFANWQIALSDGAIRIPANAADIGLTVDAAATAERAVAYGRREGGLSALLDGLTGQAQVAPVFTLNTAAAETALLARAPQIDSQPVNAGVRYENGQLLPRDPQDGRALDVNATLAAWGTAALTDGSLPLVVNTLPPAITDAAPLVAAAQTLLTRPLELRLIDPIEDESPVWSIPPETWAGWLIASQDPASPFALDTAQAETYLSARESELGANPWGGARHLDLENAAAVLTASFPDGPQPWTRVYHDDAAYTVQAGETIISIAYDYGIPYPYIQQANPGVDALSVGQTITLPSRDVMLPLAIHPERRIVVSISDQHMQAFERGELVFDWVASTGISSSPTWPGVYQVLMHETNAYAANWDLWMPYFIGVYHPIPNAEFINGFHGFPTRGSSQLLWTNSLGTRVTYGCILVSNDNARALYDWAQEGVVVEITG